ncbi:MAG: exosortase-associated EpsI family protein [Opitutae bacterium]|jgi:hypothetical protein|nr:exosortase-associated EpsI family protein [Opitutae bacterium]MBT4225023.1 exosortase-associated EpsI family protein [Opitutae bacterium]MBT5689912.1 exosortase-associated EpsI family protein [Opitutae bacterium]MBT6462724.1 exosortase-associated EpsI family protein [Opitutae bacterium]MBT6958065.1 exosortase-associated EpsI family protein [Opitutae bacterium]
MKKALLVLGTLFVLMGIILQFMPRPDRSSAGRGVHLKEALPFEVHDWDVEERELGETEAVRAATDKQLRFDDHVFRVYSKGRISFDVYVAYWAPGKMPIQLVASHTPDRCWTENGWLCTDMQFSVALHKRGLDLKPAEVRSFEMDRNIRNVIYWHLVEGEPYEYGRRFNDTPHLGKWLQGFWDGLWQGQPEQYFIRVSSPLPFKELWREPVFLEVVDSLSEIGLKKEAS